MGKSASSNKYYETILDWFKAQIMSGALKEGDVIPSERELAAQFSVSRVPVREALRILEYIGIISNTPDGLTLQKVDVQMFHLNTNFAMEITRETLQNLFEVRTFIESAAAHHAALRRTDQDLQLMRESIHQMSSAIDSPDKDEEAMIRASHEFHFRVVGAVHNPVLDNVYRSLYDLLQVSKEYTLHVDCVSHATLMDHEAILYKIENRNAEDASKYVIQSKEKNIQQPRSCGYTAPCIESLYIDKKTT